MKKILALFGSLSLVTVASATIISCTIKVNNIIVTVGSEDFADGVNVNGDTKKYSLEQLGQATSGSPIPTLMSLSQLFSKNQYSQTTINSDIFNVLTNSSRKFVRPNRDNAQLRNARDIFAGREGYLDADSNSESERYIRPSVDGVIIPQVENEDKYYGSFTTTSINSIEGLYRLANYSGTVGTGLTASKTIATSAFDKNEVGKEFAQLFTAEKSNPYGEAVFSKIEYNASKTVKEIFAHYETQATIFDNSQKVDVGANLTTSATGDYKTVNNLTDKVEEDAKKRIYERFETDPVGRLILNGKNGAAQPTATTTLKVVDKSEKDVQPMIQLENSTTLYLYNDGSVEEPKYVLMPNQFFYQPVTDLEMTYHFNTDFRNNRGKTYKIDFTLENLSAIWTPLLLESKVEVEGKKQRQIVWTFQGYKFSKGSGVLGYKGKEGLTLEEDKEKLQFERDHRFQDFNISSLTISD